MAITATVNTTRTVVGSVSQGNQPQVTRVTVPGPKGDTGAQATSESLSINDIGNVDASGLADGALLQYSTASSKWVARNELDTSENNSLRLNAGSF